MTCGDETVATVAQAWFAWGDTYALEVANDADALTALCVLLAIDCVNSDTTVAAGATAGTVAAPRGGEPHGTKTEPFAPKKRPQMAKKRLPTGAAGGYNAGVPYFFAE